MYDKPICFRLFAFDSGFWGSDDVDEVAINGGGMDAEVEGLDLPNSSWQSALYHLCNYSIALSYIEIYSLNFVRWLMAVFGLHVRG